jgi:hypothetical protein
MWRIIQNWILNPHPLCVKVAKPPRGHMICLHFCDNVPTFRSRLTSSTWCSRSHMISAITEGLLEWISRMWQPAIRLQAYS